MDYIHSRQNPVVKHLIKLAGTHRERVRSRQAVISGAHLIEAALQARFPLRHVFLRDGSTDAEVRALAATAVAAGSRVTTLSGELFHAIEQMPSQTGLLALIDWPEGMTLDASRGAVYLENVQDPGNVGSILRTAAATATGQVWLSKGCADVWSPKVLRAAMGAHFVLDLIEDVTIADLPRASLAVTTLERATSLYTAELPAEGILAFGAEGGGVSAELLERADVRLHIPMNDRIDSLNVAAAAAVCLFERQRRQQQDGLKS